MNSEVRNHNQHSETMALDLVAQICQGEQAAIWELYSLYQAELSQQCLVWMHGNSHDADEALSRLVLKAWESLPRHAHKITNAKAWLMRMAYNICIDIHRQQQRELKRLQPLDSLLGNDETIPQSATPSPETALLKREVYEAINQALQNLSPRLNSTFSLWLYNDMSCNAIAQHQGISLANVYKRLQQARDMLQPQLRPTTVEG